MSSHAIAPEPAVALVGYLASHERVAGDPSLSLADNRMQRGYAAALAGQYADLTVISTVVAHVGQGSATVESSDDGLAVRHLGAAHGPLRVVLKPLALARELHRWARPRRGRPLVLVHYNTFLLYVLVATWLRLWHRVRIVPVAITMPYQPPDARVSLSARVQGRISRGLLARVDGLVAITPFLGAELAPSVPSLVVRGAVTDDLLGPDASATEPQDAEDPDRRTRIVYAGNLSSRYNLAAAVAMMDHLPADGFVLDVYGRGALEPLVRAADASRPHVRFHGAVEESAVAPLLRDADVLLALLVPDDGLARLTFPSKLFESLASGTPTLTTDLPTLDDALREQLVVVTDLAPEALAAQVLALSSRTPAQQRAAAADARQYLLDHATWSAVGERLRTFLDGLETPSHD